MKDYLKYGSVLAVCIVVLVIFFGLKSWIGPGASEKSTLTVPVDPNFNPIVEKEYRPPSTPFERPSKPPVTLPKGVREKDVKRIITVMKKMPVASGDSVVVDTTHIVETKSGEVFIPKQSGKEVSVQELGFVPSILSWGWLTGIGVSVGRSDNMFSFSPVAAAAPLEIYGTVQLPLMMADLHGIGVGAGYHYSDFVFGAVGHWSFEDARQQYKLVVLYSIN